MKLIPCLIVGGGIAARIEELPIVHSMTEARNIIMNLPKHLIGHHVEYIEELEGTTPQDDGGIMIEIRPCGGLEDEA